MGGEVEDTYPVCGVDEHGVVYSLFCSSTNGAGNVMSDAQAPPKKLSKKEQKRLARGDDPSKGGSSGKKERDPNRWAVDPEKAKAKAEKAAKAKADKAAKAKKEAEDDEPAPETPKGEKKRLTKVMAKTYDPTAVEASWQEWWEQQGFYGCAPEKAAGRAKEDKFVIVIPPPNVTGSLHLGHALTAAIEDCLTRWHRMRGDATLYVPGTDHAGIATQSVVEKMLAKQTPPVSRHDLGREKFTKEVWKWKDQYGSRICRQLRRLGSSVDWTRERFTMDPVCAKAVTEAFVRLHDAGVTYRASRLVNWSCALKSAISDLEVDYLELNGGELRTVPGHGDKQYQFGTFTEFAYQVVDDETGELTGDEVVVATTRLETMLGDAAVAIHPTDERYFHLHGKKVRHPFFPSRKVPIILDDVLVDKDLGTGCVKITPAHDPNDYECGKRHGLPFLTIFTVEGDVVKEATPFSVLDDSKQAAGTSSSNKSEAQETQNTMHERETFPAWVAGAKRYEARLLVEAKLESLGLLRGKSPKPMRLAVCSRSGDIIEPLVQPQWFVDCSGMAKRSCDAVRDGSLRIRPKTHEKTWFQWLENIRPWCVSRQLWWGHQIPAWFALADGEDPEAVDKNAPANAHRWIVARDEAEAAVKAKDVLMRETAGDSTNGEKKKKTLKSLTRDEDVLDTWFSSGLFPFSVFGWPDKTPELAAFYPTTLLETGLDILFFWVARMVMLGLQLTDTLPFTDVYLHAMVRDKEGRKMSKSLGNVIDPLEVIDGCPLERLIDRLKSGNLKAVEVERAEKGHREDFPDGIPTCGTDALRVGLLAYTVQGRDINLDIKRVVGYRSFCNKLWNALRLAIGCFGDFAFPVVPAFKNAEDSDATTLEKTSAAPRDRFILSRLACALDAVDDALRSYAFADAVAALYRFFLDDLCDVYLELIKPVVYENDDNGATTTTTTNGRRDNDNHGGSSSDRKTAAKRTLWVCLDAGLRALHPFCPFVTEELWQRLPRATPRDAPFLDSIMLAPYPTAAALRLDRDEALEAQTRTVVGAVAAARSLRQQYNLAKKPAKFFVKFAGGDDDKAAAFARQQDDFATLARAETVTILEDGAAAPPGCALKIVDEFVSVLVDLKGLVDVDAEIAKLRKQVADLEPLVAKLEAKQRDPAYLANAPEKQRASDAEKLKQYTDRRDVARAAIAGWEQTR